MPALEPQYMAILKKVLAERFVPSLPPLLDTTKPAAEQQAKQLSRAFSAFALHKLLDIAPTDAAMSVVDDFNDKGLDAIHYHSQTETLYLVQTKLKESEQFKQEDAQSFCTGIRLLLKQDFAGFNENIQNRKAEIENALDGCSHIKLIIPYTGNGISQSAIDALQVLLDDGGLDEERLDKQVGYYAAADIVRDLLAEQAYQPVNADIFLLKNEKVEVPKTTYFGIAKLADLVGLHNVHGKALYERNIRYFLGTRSEVNRAIKITLQDDPSSFFYLNNGVTAVCDAIKQKGRNSISGYKRFEVRGLSIINGAQTVASAAEVAASSPPVDISEAKVMLTIIKARTDSQFGKRVTKARNHQNPVQAANFASLDENQERLRQEISHLDFTYHYRPEASAASGTNPIMLDEAIRAQALQQKDPRYPAWVKGEFTRLSNSDGAEYQALFTASLTGYALINGVLCYRVIRDFVTSYDKGAPSGSQERLIYRHGSNVIASVMMKRLRQRLGKAEIVDGAAINVLIGPHLDQLRQEAANLGHALLGASGPLAFFRNQGDVASFLASLMETHYGLAADPTVIQLRGITNPADAYPRKGLIDYLSDRAPQL
ncbi:AIPR family protein [Dyella flava]|uniref:AIPR family protein n=1 Tax=Dyella flava TaxID=1920170 RepID=A0ABS2JZI4_9GAMM|nr:AIPR family protein [Dyella flava]MBM7124412.1 AIPR family protein [Dyella flava]GLQ52501.1 hypothetical protein GCM10010872_39500 [Dyella flava]